MLNYDYRPICITSWKRAITLVLLSDEVYEIGASLIESYDKRIRRANGESYPMPAVIRLNRYIYYKRKVPLSKRNLLIRDDLTCQYCHRRFMPKELTFDHVLPKSLWFKYPQKRMNKHTPTHWENVVAACFRCNIKKGNRTPSGANMQLLKDPKRPDPTKYIRGYVPWQKTPKEWRKYLLENQN